MRPLNYAILKYFTNVSKASLKELMEFLKEDYAKFKAFNKHSLSNALMTAEANGLIEEVDFDLDENGELLIYYKANEDSKQTINNFIKD